MTENWHFFPYELIGEFSSLNEFYKFFTLRHPRCWFITIIMDQCVAAYVTNVNLDLWHICCFVNRRNFCPSYVESAPARSYERQSLPCNYIQRQICHLTIIVSKLLIDFQCARIELYSTGIRMSLYSSRNLRFSQRVLRINDIIIAHIHNTSIYSIRVVTQIASTCCWWHLSYIVVYDFILIFSLRYTYNTYTIHIQLG